MSEFNTILHDALERQKQELKPCPFCGVVPKLWWEAWREISPVSGCYHLEAQHTKDCYILHMNGTNSTGRTSAFNKECLIDWWNRRAGETE